MAATVFANGTVITMDPTRRIIEGGAVRVIGDRIVQVGANAEIEIMPDDRVIDCRNKVIIPGLIDAHGHAGHCLIRSIAADTNPFWMKIVTPVYYHYTTRTFWYADGLVSGLERLRAGVTTSLSIISSMPRSDDPEFAIQHAKAYGEIGLREVVSVGPAGLPWPRSVTRWDTGDAVSHKVSFSEMMEGTEAVIQSIHGAGNGKTSVYVTPFTIVPSLDPSNMSTPDQAVSLTKDDRNQARAVRELARKYKVRMHSDAFAGQVRLAYQDKENALLGPDIHLQHCWGISHEEIDILAETGTHVTHAPPGRSTPVIEMMARGVSLAVTSDGTAPSRYFDMLQTARNFQSTQHVLRNHDRYFFPPGKVLEMITIDAARTLGMENEIGSIEVGKKADIAIIDMNQPHLTPNWLPVHRLVHQATGGDVDTVMVDGEILMENRKVMRVDVAAALALGNAEAQELVVRGGLQQHLHAPGWGQVYRTFDRQVELPNLPI